MLNMNFTKRVVINTVGQDWVASQLAGVWRKPLAREEAERGHATSIVRYDPGASFSAHDHPLGEEILVLEGTFSDETGDYPAGTYFRNPEGFRHAPFSVDGCLILVKLHQFQEGDARHVSIDTQAADWKETSLGVKVLQLHEFGQEQVRLIGLPAGASLEHEAGEEIFVINGELVDDDGNYPVGTWVRNPIKAKQSLAAELQTLIWIKTGHL
jgi:anti-sigma factor ChrR (cupin superfamily)